MTPGERTHRVLVCDDSPTFAKGLAHFLAQDEAIEVVQVAGSAEEALRHLDALRPDLVTMDLEMPGMGGVRGIEEIMRRRPTPILVVSARASLDSDLAADAMAAGALEALAKEGLRLDRPDDIWATAARGRVKRLATVRLKRRAPNAARRSPHASLPLPDHPARVIGIGASTGGPPALLGVLEVLPADYPLPLLVVQHMMEGFLGGLVRWLDERVALPVRFAREGDEARPGVWVAPDGAHLTVDGNLRFAPDRETVAGSHRPSVDVLLTSLAESAGAEAVGVVLTGMGRDGALGVTAMRAAGGLVLAQDEESSAVFGMPRAAIEAGADPVLPLDEIGAALARLRERVTT